MIEEQKSENRELPAEQGEEELIGDCNPPKEYQFKPGQSGNPKGTPPSRCNLWRHVCKYMNMPYNELKEIVMDELKAVDRTALKLVLSMADGEQPGAESISKHFFDREEGRVAERIFFTNENKMSDEKVDNVREILKKIQEL